MERQRRKYALVGVGGRAKMFIDAIADTYYQWNELVGLCDLSRERMDWYNQRLSLSEHADVVPTYLADEFDQMIADTRPDTVIVTTMDSTHHLYITRAMELGCDVITEKPMTIDAEKAHAIFNAIGRTGRDLTVTFNYRYAPISTKVGELLRDGVVGRPLHVNFQWVLDTFHGADYFRRWHREKDKSGGLLVHKATHHFDLINWWLQSYPSEVFAMGGLSFYGSENAKARGERYSYQRYTGEEEAYNDPFSLRLDGNDTLRALYLNAEKDSGYIRDRNVFGDNITAEDTMSLTARYRNQVYLTYSLVAYSPWEGYRIAITGDKGRLEIELVEQVGRQFVAGQAETPERDEKIVAQFGGKHIWVFPMFSKPYEVTIPEARGSHGGGDRAMLEQIFSTQPPPDPFGRAASHIDGAAAMLLGAAANRSIATGLPIRVDDMLALPERD